jgi:hypothetical protein
MSLNRQAAIVDISHSIRPQDVFQAAFLLHTAWGYFPEGTIHIVVVDPGVGSGRRILLLKTPRAYFIAPDNGVLSYILAEISPGIVKGEASFPELPDDLRMGEVPSGVEAYALTNARFWRQPVSSTFHGRDIFAPVAAHLSLGVPMAELGEVVSSVLVFPIPRPLITDKGIIHGHIVHVDGFGNLVTDVRAEDIPSGNLIIEAGGHRVRGLSPSYSAGGELLALIGSSGYMEVAAKNGNAAERLGLGVGDAVIIRKLRGGQGCGYS